MWLFGLGILVSAFLQAVFLPLHAALLFVVLTNLRQEEESWGRLFLAGVVFDLIVGLPVGFSSLVFLLAGLLIRLVKETGYGSVVAGGVIFSGTLATGFFETRSWQWQPALVTVALGLVIWFLGRWWGWRQSAKRLQL